VNRPVLYTSLGLVALLIAAGITAYSQREKIGRFWVNPRTPYQTYVRPPAPHYEREEAWAALPGKTSRANVVPEGLTASTQIPQADVFYVHPTTYYKAQEWNGPIDSRNATRRVDEIALPVQASAFNGAGRIFAPRYRQATLYAFLTHIHDGRLAQRAAYTDVADAFSYYLQHYNEGRPLIIAGYGQGALHIIRLLQEFVVGKDLQQRFIAAYIIDFALPQDLFDVSLNTLKLCQTPDETQCIVTWNALENGKKPHEILDRSQVWNIFGSLRKTEGRPLACINPLTWAENELPAPRTLNHGGVALQEDRFIGPVPEITNAQCRGGILYYDAPKDARFHHFEWPGARHRIVPYNFFYMNIRENASVRTRAFITAHMQPGRTSQAPQTHPLPFNAHDDPPVR